MRCICCNKSIGTLFMVSIHEDYICKKCLKEKGFTKKELQELPYWLQSWEYLKDGKEGVQRAMDVKARTKTLKINLGDVEDPKVERVLNGLKDGLFEYELFGGYTIEDLKEDLDEHQHHIYGGMDFDCEVKREGDKAIALINGQQVAETEYKNEMDLGKNYLIVNGGKYRQVIDGKNCSGQDPYWLMLKIVYVK